MDELGELREQLDRRCLLVQSVTDGRAVEALHAEIARLREKISQLEANQSDQPKRRDHIPEAKPLKSSKFWPFGQR
jgi:predicted  nucleic acid-binding Zn-ribbon protein